MGNLTYPPQTYFIGTENKPIVLTFSKINQVFQKYLGQSNSLDLASFNKCLNELTHFGTLPFLAYTYLSQRCFEMITNYNTIPLTCDRFAMALLTALSCNDTRSLILFNAIKQNQGQNFVTFLDILNFFKKSWEYNFKYIYDYINYCLRDEFMRNNVVIPSNPQELYRLIGLHEEDLKNYLITSLYDSGFINIKDRIMFDFFKKWALKDNNTDISYAGKNFKFANSLIFMESIGVNTKVN